MSYVNVDNGVMFLNKEVTQMNEQVDSMFKAHAHVSIESFKHMLVVFNRRVMLGNVQCRWTNRQQY